MANWPCTNPSCKSHGQPHPNCKCPAPMAKGGKVSHYCATDRKHLKDCHFYAEGGDVSASSEGDWETITPQHEQAPISGGDDQWETVAPEASEDHGADSEWESESDHYSTPAQKLLTAVEGAAQGVAGPLATAAELGLSKIGVPGLSAEDIAARQAENPWTHGLSEAAGVAGSMLIGTGEAALAAKTAAKTAEFFELGKVGSKVLSGAISSGIIQGGDEISKAMLGQGDPETPVASALINIGAAGLFGAVGGGLTGGASKAAEALGDSKAGTNVQRFLMGMGWSSKGLSNEQALIKANGLPKATAAIKSEAYKLGEKFYKTGIEKVVNGTVHAATDIAGGVIGSHTPIGPIGGALLADKAIAEPLSKFLGKNITESGKKYGIPMMLKMMGSDGEARQIYKALDYAAHVDSGFQKTSRAVGSLFGAGTQQVINNVDLARNRQKLKEYIENGGINQNIQQEIYDQAEQPQGFAEGGEVKGDKKSKSKPVKGILDNDDPIAIHYPEQNTLINTAKGRISNYLSSQQPPKFQPRSAFDTTLPNKSADKSYDRALDIANDPLSVVGHIANGTLLPEHVKHLNAMYPEVNNMIQKQLTDQITKAQLSGKKPSYKVRQGMSLLMGTNLDSTFTPANIMAAQATFAKQASQQQAQAPIKNKRGTSSLTKADDAYLTGDQARIARQNKV